MRGITIFVSFLTLSLSITSTTFNLLALTSPRWSRQTYYDTAIGGGSPTTWDTPLCFANRSPFYRCSVPSVVSGFEMENGTTTCEVECAFYKPYGWNATSCRSPFETGADDFPLNGGVMECQEGEPPSYMRA